MLLACIGEQGRDGATIRGVDTVVGFQPFLAEDLRAPRLPR